MRLGQSLGSERDIERLQLGDVADISGVRRLSELAISLTKLLQLCTTSSHSVQIFAQSPDLVDDKNIVCLDEGKRDTYLGYPIASCQLARQPVKQTCSNNRFQRSSAWSQRCLSHATGRGDRSCRA